MARARSAFAPLILPRLAHLTFRSSSYYLIMNVLKNGWNSKSNNSSSGGSGGSKWIPTVPGADRIGKRIPTGVVRTLYPDTKLPRSSRRIRYAC